MSSAKKEHNKCASSRKKTGRRKTTRVSKGSSEALPSEPSKIPALVLPKQSKKNARNIVTIDDINEMQLAVLRKEHIKLDLEIENLHLNRQEIMLRIQELESRSNIFSC